MKFFRFLTLW